MDTQEQKKDTTINQPPDLSRFTLFPPSVDTEEKKVVFTPSVLSDEQKNPFIQYFTSNPLWIGVYIILLWVAIVSGVYLFRTELCTEKDVQQTIPTVIPTQDSLSTPTATETAVDISLFSVTVLNGTGVEEEAEGVKSLLEEGGFTVTNTGKADRNDYEGIVVYIKESVPEQITEELQKLIGDFDTISDESYESEGSDIVIIVGRQ